MVNWITAFYNSPILVVIYLLLSDMWLETDIVRKSFKNICNCWSLYTNFAAIHIFFQAFLKWEYLRIMYVCTKCFRENIKDRNTSFLWCLKGKVISYSFKTPKMYSKACHFAFCCTWKVKLQRYPLWVQDILLELHFSLGFIFVSGRFVLQKCLKVSTSSCMPIRACRIYLVSVFHNWM